MGTELDAGRARATYSFSSNARSLSIVESAHCVRKWATPWGYHDVKTTIVLNVPKGSVQWKHILMYITDALI